MITIKTTIKKLESALKGKCYLHENTEVAEMIDGYIGKKPIFYIRSFNPKTFENTFTMEVDGTSARRNLGRMMGDEYTKVEISTDIDGLWIETQYDSFFVPEIDYKDKNYFNPRRSTLQS